MNKRAPQHEEDTHCSEIHSFGECTANQGRSNNEKHALKYDKDQLVRWDSIFRGWQNTAHEDMVQIAEVGISFIYIASERETVTAQGPDDGHPAHQEKNTASQSSHRERASFRTKPQ